MLAWMNAESLAETLCHRPGHLLVPLPRRASGARARPPATSSASSSSASTATATACLLIVEQTGPACHTNRPSCFFTAVRDGAEVILADPVRVVP